MRIAQPQSGEMFIDRESRKVDQLRRSAMCLLHSRNVVLLRSWRSILDPLLYKHFVPPGRGRGQSYRQLRGCYDESERLSNMSA